MMSSRINYQIIISISPRLPLVLVILLPMTHRHGIHWILIKPRVTASVTGADTDHNILRPTVILLKWIRTTVPNGRHISTISWPALSFIFKDSMWPTLPLHWMRYDYQTMFSGISGSSAITIFQIYLPEPGNCVSPVLTIRISLTMYHPLLSGCMSGSRRWVSLDRTDSQVLSVTESCPPHTHH